MSFHHQDWETVVLKKPKPPPKNTPKIKNTEGEEGSECNLMKAPVSLKTKIQKARMTLKMSQKDLATKMNLPVKTIQEYENGKAIPNNKFIASLERHLGCSLPRASKKCHKKD